MSKQVAAPSDRPLTKPRSQTLRSFDDMVESFSHFSKYYSDVDQESQSLEVVISCVNAGRDEHWQLEGRMQRAEAALNAVEVSGVQRTKERLLAALREFTPDNDPDIDDDLNPKRHYIAKQVAVLLGSIPNGTPADPEVYTAMLIEEVLALGVYKHAIESGMRRCRRTTKFLPAISEVLAILKEENKLWDRRLSIHSFDDRIDILREQIADAKSLIAKDRKQKEAAKQRAIEVEAARKRCEEENGTIDFG